MRAEAHLHTRAYLTRARPGATGWLLQSLLVAVLLGVGTLAALVTRSGDAGLVRVLATDDGGAPVAGASYPLYLEYRARATAFSELAAYFDSLAVVLEPDSGAEEVIGALVSGNYFEVLGARAALGRAIVGEDERLGARVVVLSNRAWQRSLLGDSSVIGRALRLNGRSFTVVGVMPPEFRDAGGGPALWVPISAIGDLSPAAAELQPLRRRGLWWLSMVGRLAPDASMNDARAQLETIASRLAAGNALDPRPRVVPLGTSDPGAAH
jgi:hypothetical protein